MQELGLLLGWLHTISDIALSLSTLFSLRSFFTYYPASSSPSLECNLYRDLPTELVERSETLLGASLYSPCCTTVNSEASKNFTRADWFTGSPRTSPLLHFTGTGIVLQFSPVKPDGLLECAYIAPGCQCN
ncbi:hypothetical protein DNTS_018254 [Danionella cerebrum]|uniref:Uncharacterized protein n=1 Tax=Danionella cerebrum TaxID=2873325 RepID=A0A553QJC4_9TELE|nr:hypothetical protein DNTS_018254 [Danionella translucida]